MGVTETKIGTGPKPRPPVAMQVINGRYRVERLIGGGGCGLVYAGRHEILGKPVAIKMLRPELVRDVSQAQRFFREAKLAATLHHENIVDITDFGSEDATGVPYLVMELLRGRTLMAAVRDDGALPWQRAVTILLQLSRALACAHAQGVLHRDIKPHNVMLAEVSGRAEHVKLCDFGLSRLRSGDDRITSTGNFVGTPAYMAPEQIRGGDQDERCDIYALGVTAYEMLTGSLPYKASEPVALVAEIIGDKRVPLRERLTGEAPDALIALVDRCLASDPKDRPASALDIERELLAISQQRGPAIADLKGHVVGSYRVLDALGSGATGAVWLAEHPVIGTKVAIKVLRPEIVAEPDAVARFINEARAASMIPSGNIARYLDFGWLPSGQPYAILEYLSGETLHDRIARLERLSTDSALSIARQIAGALVHAHAAGIVHRDIKPANIFLANADGGAMVKVLDFGIAKLSGAASSDAPKTAVGFFMGTVLYCPPEQLLGDAIGPAADVYALGATLYEMIAGRAPFIGEATEIATAKTTREAPSLAQWRPDAPADVIALVDAMVAQSPRQRPTMEHVVARLSGAAIATPSARSPSFTGGRTLRRIAAGAVAAVLVAFTAWLAWPSTPTPAAPPASSATVEPIASPPVPVPVPVRQPEPAPAPVAGAPVATTPAAPAPTPTPTPKPVPTPPHRAQPSSHATQPAQPIAHRSTDHPAPAAPPAATPATAKPKTDVIIADPFGSH